MIEFTSGNEYSDVDDAMILKENLSMEEKRGNYSQVWQYMAKIVLRAKPGIVKQNVNDYVPGKLGRKDGDTFLAEFYRLPKPSANKFPSELVERYGIKTKSQYYRNSGLVEYRINRLSKFIS